mgnify:CR=1 FL=1
MDKDKIKGLLQKCADWLDNMNTKSIDDSYKKVAIFEAIKEIYAEMDHAEADHAEEGNDAGTDH